MKLRRFCDLDGTMIFSYRHMIENRILVEMYEGRELSYMSEEVYKILQTIPKSQFVPVTSRTKEQYGRLSFYQDGGVPKYALIDNGGILLVDGKEDEAWTEDTWKLVNDDMVLLRKIIIDLTNYGTIKIQDGMIFFVKPFSNSEEIIIKERIGKYPQFQTFQHGNKLYVCSSKLTKGNAIDRFKKRFQTDYAIAAGDAVVDLSMAYETEKSFYKKELDDYIKDIDRNRVSFVMQEELAIQILSYACER